MSAGCNPARSMAALMETAPSSGERTELKEPIIPPIGVLAEPAMTISLFMFYVLLQRNLVGVLVLLIGLVWAPSLPDVRAGLRGGCWIFFGKTTRFAQTSFSGKKSNNHPAPTGIGGFSRDKNSCSVWVATNSMQRSLVLQVALVAFCFLYSAFLCCTSVGGCGVFFRQGKRCLSEASCFSQKKNTPHPAYLPASPASWVPKRDHTAK